MSSRSRIAAAVLLAALLVLAAWRRRRRRRHRAGIRRGRRRQRVHELRADRGDPVDGGTLVFPATADVDTLDVHKSASTHVHTRVGLVYNRLLAYEAGPDVDYTEQKLVGDLAETWEVADDGLTYTFHLRDGVRWQDVAPLNGRPFVADDVVATMQRVKEIGHQAYMLTNVDEVVAVDDLTVEFRLSAPFARSSTTWPARGCGSSRGRRSRGSTNVETTAIGTGPFIMERREPRVTTTYRKNPDFFREGLPHLDQVEYPVITDPAGQVAAFRAGKLDLGRRPRAPRSCPLCRRSVPGSELLTYVVVTQPFLSMDQAVEPWSDPLVREAVSLAVDREAMIETIWGGGVPGAR